MKVVRVKEVAKQGLVSDWFTGPVNQQPLFGKHNSGTNFNVSKVNYPKGVKINAHVHNTEQLIIVLSGTGIAANEREQVLLKPGDVALFEPGEKHWHAATDEADMSHLSITLIETTTKFTGA